MNRPLLRLVFSVVALVVCFAAPAIADEVKVEAIGFTERTIYHSPETPGYTAWVGFWRLPNGRLRYDFTQVTGPKAKPVVTRPVFESQDNGVTWSHLVDTPTETVILDGIIQSLRDCGRGMSVSPDGTLVRPIQPSVFMKESGYVERSTDGGQTWSGKIFFLSPEEYRTAPTLIRPLRDGRLVLFAGCWKIDDFEFGKTFFENMFKAMFISTDKGLTWSKPIVIQAAEPGQSGTEESDFCELPNGDLFWVHRVQQRFSRMQSLVRKVGDSFVPDKCEVSALPHSGFPMVLYTREGIILHLSTRWAYGEFAEGRPLDGICWTADLGKTWTRLEIPGTPYYPNAIQLDAGTITLIGHWHNQLVRLGGDNQYGTVDQSIKQQTFRLRVTRTP